MQIAQLIAAHAVAEVLDGHNLTVSLPKAQGRYKSATPQQRAAAQDLSYLTLRFYAEAEAVLRALTSKRLTDKRVQGLLLVALAQLLHGDVQVFTVVNQAVEAAGRLKLSWAKGLVNGVLRQFERERESLLSKLQQRETVRYNYPQWWIDMLKSQYPQHWQAILQQGNLHPPMTLRVNLQQTTVEEYLALLAQAGIEARALGGAAIQLAQPMPVLDLPGFAAGQISVQDAAAQWAAPLLDVQSGMRVLDACSAPGGKTGHLLEWCHTHGLKNVQLTALDVDAQRLRRVEENLQRLGISANILLGDAGNTDWFDGQQYDRILADVPCTASGIVRRHVEMKWLRRPQDIAAFARQQQQILRNLWQILAKDGKLLYVTCSVFQQENDMLLQQFLAEHTDARCLPMSFAHTSGVCPIRIDGQLLPAPEHDGLFYALLEKH